jgi:hypothetical protein
MTPEPGAPSNILVRAWRAVVRAFSRAPDAPQSQQYGAETTLFGGATEQPRDRTGRDGVKNEFWLPSETTDFADLDAEGEARRRR